MQTSDRVLAGRYGRAVFLAAVGAKEEDRVLRELHAAQAALLSARATLRNPQVSAADKKKKIRETLGAGVAPLTVKFLEMLIDKKRFDLLPLMTATLSHFIAEKNNAAKAHVRTARPLPPEAQAKLKERLKSFSGKNVELDIKEDPEIIGGLIVRLGDWVLDSSLRGQLRKMRETLNGN